MERTKRLKKILIHSLVFSPDGVSTAYLYNDIARAFQDRGYQVVVLTTTPHFNPNPIAIKKQILEPKFGGLYHESDYNGIRVVHIPQKKHASTFMRLIGFVYWHVMALLLAMRESKIDIILSPSPPITIGIINLMIGKLKNAQVIYNVQEIYPDFLIEQRHLNNRIVVFLLKWVERTVYNKSDAVTTIDQLFYDTIVPRFENSKKLKIIPNFVNTTIYKPHVDLSINLNRKYFKDNNALKVMYAGNVGHAQDWKLLVSAAKLLINEDIEFYIIGEGVMKKYLRDEKDKYKLTNIHLIPYQPRAVMPALIGFSDIQFIFMSTDTERHGFPSKVYTIMACGKPILVSSGINTPIVKFLSDKDCAYIASHKNMDQRVAEITLILRSHRLEDFNQKGKNGIKLVKSIYSHKVIPGKYVDLSDKLILS